MTDSITNPRYPTWRSAAKQLWKEGKIKVYLFSLLDHFVIPNAGNLQAVYRGFVPCILRAFPTVRVLFSSRSPQAYY